MDIISNICTHTDPCDFAGFGTTSPHIVRVISWELPQQSLDDKTILLLLLLLLLL